jgi:hypothetical protein
VATETGSTVGRDGFESEEVVSTGARTVLTRHPTGTVSRSGRRPVRLPTETGSSLKLERLCAGLSAPRPGLSSAPKLLESVSISEYHLLGSRQLNRPNLMEFREDA